MEGDGGIEEDGNGQDDRRVKVGLLCRSHPASIADRPIRSFSKDNLQELLSTSTVKPVVNQILLHPYVIKSTAPLLEYMDEQHIIAEGYSTLIPLTSKPGGPVDKPVDRIAKRLKVKPEQVLLAWSKAKQ